MSWLCLVCECIHALCLSNFARPSFPSFFGWSCWFVAQLNKIAQQTDRWMKIISTRPCLRLRTNLGPRIAFWVLIWVVFWSLFRVPFLGTVLGPYNYKQNPRPQNRAQKWNPKPRKTACFEALVLEPHFAQSCGLFLLLYCILGWQSSLQASFHWKMQSVKLPVCPTPPGCICSNSGVTVEQFAQRASETGEQSFAMGTFWESWRRCWRPRAPFKQCWFVRSRAYKDFSSYARSQHCQAGVKGEPGRSPRNLQRKKESPRRRNLIFFFLEFGRKCSVARSW